MDAFESVAGRPPKNVGMFETTTTTTRVMGNKNKTKVVYCVYTCPV
jgi:hypothetical protein